MLTADSRGPWEILWHHFLDIANGFGLEDRYKLYVFGKYLLNLQYTSFSLGLELKLLLFGALPGTALFRSLGVFTVNVGAVNFS